MKATGIIRRIDDLGRVVIPKEIRRRLSIDENDPVEFYVDGDRVIIEKYISTYNHAAQLQKLKNNVLDDPSIKNSQAIAMKLEELKKLFDKQKGEQNEKF